LVYNSKHLKKLHSDTYIHPKKSKKKIVRITKVIFPDNGTKFFRFIMLLPLKNPKTVESEVNPNVTLLKRQIAEDGTKTQALLLQAFRFELPSDANASPLLQDQFQPQSVSRRH